MNLQCSVGTLNLNESLVEDESLRKDEEHSLIIEVNFGHCHRTSLKSLSLQTTIAFVLFFSMYQKSLTIHLAVLNA